MLYNKNGRVVNDEVLAHPREDMHPAIAVANLIKIWLSGDAVQCCSKLNGLVKQGNISLRPDGTGTIIIDQEKYDVVTFPAYHQYPALPERCVGDRQTHVEKFWILNPGANGPSRWVIKVDRPKLAAMVDKMNLLCQDKANATIYGMNIH